MIIYCQQLISSLDVIIIKKIIIKEDSNLAAILIQ